MSSPRKRVLADGLFNRLVGVQKAREVYESLWKWKWRLMHIDIDKKREASQEIAERVEKYAEYVQRKTHKSATAVQVMKKIERELKSFKI